MSRHLAPVALPVSGSSHETALQGSSREHCLTVNEGSGHHRLAAWREALGATATIEIDAAAVATFEGEFRTRVIGPLMAVRLCAHTFRFIRSEEMARQIVRDNVFINLCESGLMVGTSNGRRVSVGPGDVIFSRHGGTQESRNSGCDLVRSDFAHGVHQLAYALDARARGKSLRRSNDGRRAARSPYALDDGTAGPRQQPRCQTHCWPDDRAPDRMFRNSGAQRRNQQESQERRCGGHSPVSGRTYRRSTARRRRRLQDFLAVAIKPLPDVQRERRHPVHDPCDAPARRASRHCVGAISGPAVERDRQTTGGDGHSQLPARLRQGVRLHAVRSAHALRSRSFAEGLVVRRSDRRYRTVVRNRD